MSLPFLKREYLPVNSTLPKYDEVYKTILTYQAKDDQSPGCFLLLKLSYGGLNGGNAF